MSPDLHEVYKAETVGKHYHVPIVSKKGGTFQEPPAEEVVSVNLNEPIKKEEFRKLSDSSKIMYIKHLRERYEVTATQIAEMLGYNPCHFSAYIVSPLNLKGLFKHRAKPSRKQISEWKKFLIANETTAEANSSPVLKKETPPLTMFCNCSFTLKGELRVSDIAAKIQAMVADGTPCSISVAINSIDENGGTI